jgi:hypothetical protein
MGLMADEREETANPMRTPEVEVTQAGLKTEHPTQQGVGPFDQTPATCCTERQ